MLKKEEISLVQDQEKGFFEQSFSNSPVINLKKLNKHIPYEHFKRESLYYIKFLLQQGGYISRLDKGRIFFYSIAQRIQENDTLSMTRPLICQCFGLGPAPTIFTKLLKTPLSILRKLNIRIIIYKQIIRILRDNMLLQRKTFQQVLMAKDTDIFLLEHLGFAVNLKKIEFTGLTQCI